MKLHILELPAIDPCEAFSPLSGQPYALFLDSADRTHQDARYSFIACNPVEMIEAKDGLVTVTNARQQTSFRADPFETVKERVAAWGFKDERNDDLPPFRGGVAGLFGYDLGRGIEEIQAQAQPDADMPDMAVGIYDQVIAFDHQQNKAWIFTHAVDEEAAASKREFLLSLMKRHSQHNVNEYNIEWSPNFTAEKYKARVHDVMNYIVAGDIFQANLSQRFDAELPANFDSFAHYRTLREVNAAPFAAYMHLGNIRISSASPERFITVKSGMVQTKPIKGTKPRLVNAEPDEQQKKALQSSEKDRAENIMIVDLMRSDLSKCCTPESVSVEKLCAVETFSRVHHLVSTITGRLKPECGPLDLLRGCFPGGSITGAPKIRAMQIIEELEPTRRGPYCGSIGYINADGGMDMNILIRTLVYKNNTVSFQTGGGITADSNADAEYQETLDKAAGMFASFEAKEKIRRTG